MECFNIENYLEKLISRCKDSFGGGSFMWAYREAGFVVKRLKTAILM